MLLHESRYRVQEVAGMLLYVTFVTTVVSSAAKRIKKKKKKRTEQELPVCCNTSFLVVYESITFSQNIQVSFTMKTRVLTGLKITGKDITFFDLFLELGNSTTQLKIKTSY